MDTFMGDDSPPPTLHNTNIKSSRLPILTGPHTPDSIHDPLGLKSSSDSSLPAPAKVESRFPSKGDTTANNQDTLFAEKPTLKQTLIDEQKAVIKDIHLASTSMLLYKSINALLLLNTK